MSNVIDITDRLPVILTEKQKVRVAMFEFSKAEGDLAVAHLTLAFLAEVSIAADVKIAEGACDGRYIRDSLRVGVFS